MWYHLVPWFQCFLDVFGDPKCREPIVTLGFDTHEGGHFWLAIPFSYGFFYCTLQIEAIASKKSSLFNDCVEANPWLCSFIHSRKNMDTHWRTAWNPETSGWLGSKNSRQSSQGLLWGLKSKWYEELCSLQGAGYMLFGASRIHLPDGGQNRFKFRKISRPVKTWSLPQIHASSMASLEVSSTCVARVYMFMLICMFLNKPRFQMFLIIKMMIDTSTTDQMMAHNIMFFGRWAVRSERVATTVAQASKAADCIQAAE